MIGNRPLVGLAQMFDKKCSDSSSVVASPPSQVSASSSANSSSLESLPITAQTPSPLSAVLAASKFELFEFLPLNFCPSFPPPFEKQSHFICPFLWQLKHSTTIFDPPWPFLNFLNMFLPFTAKNVASFGSFLAW